MYVVVEYYELKQSHSIFRVVRESTDVPVDMRIGVHSGNVLCGIIGNIFRSSLFYN